jgi:hypothetical protein
MWSRMFLWTGLISGASIAYVAWTGIWLALFIAAGSKDPNWTPANAIKFGIVGVVAYPASWYFLVYRVRDYSLTRTWFLVAVTYTAVCTVIAAFVFFGLFYAAAGMLAEAPTSPWPGWPSWRRSSA